MWNSRTKDELIIEVWEKLDCESVGAPEIEAIREAVEGRFGRAAVDRPMTIARLLADEGAELRHSEIMHLHLNVAADRPQDARLRNLLSFNDLRSALKSIHELENLRRKLVAEGDNEGLREVRGEVMDAKRRMLSEIGSAHFGPDDRSMAGEVSEWLSHWLRTPEVFSEWIAMRLRSKDFIQRFGEVGRNE